MEGYCSWDVVVYSYHKEEHRPVYVWNGCVDNFDMEKQLKNGEALVDHPPKREKHDPAWCWVSIIDSRSHKIWIIIPWLSPVVEYFTLADSGTDECHKTKHLHMVGFGRKKSVG